MSDACSSYSAAFPQAEEKTRMTLVEILCNRTRICRAAGVSRSRSDAPLFILEILFGTHYSVTRPALARNDVQARRAATWATL